MSVEWISLTLLIYVFVSLFWYLFSLFDYVIDSISFYDGQNSFLKVDGLYLKRGIRSSLGDLP